MSLLSRKTGKPERGRKPLVVFITGLSGTGKTVALRAIEDSGFFCVDNLPPQLIEEFVRISLLQKDIHRVAIGIDIREKEFISGFKPVLASLRDKYNVLTVYLEADKAALIRRYKETRRPHPVSGASIEASIDMEAGMLEPLRTQAEKILDTTNLTPHQLRDLITSMLGVKGPGFQVNVMSFGYKYGIPQNADLLFDARFLPNPFFVPELSDLNGKDEPVRRFVLGNKFAREFVKKLDGLLSFLIPHYEKEGKSSLTIGIGCTGGRHRSPAIAEHIAKRLKDSGLPVTITHRDI